jgi:hypothetical protein
VGRFSAPKSSELSTDLKIIAMTQTTFSTIEVDSKFWLAKEPIMEEPEMFSSILRMKRCKYEYPHGYDIEQFTKDMKEYEDWLKEKSGWIEIKEEHAGEFRGKTGLVEGKDFEVVKQILDDTDQWFTLEHLTSAYDDFVDECKRTVAIPIKTDQGRIVDVPIGEGEDTERSLWNDVLQIAFVELKNKCDSAYSWSPAIDELQKSFTIKRINQNE